MEDNNRSEELSSSSSSQLSGLAKGAVNGATKGVKKAINFAKKKMGKALKAKIKLLLSQSLLILLPYLIGGIILGTVVIAFQSGIFAKDIDKIAVNFDENGDRELREEVQQKIAEINSQIPEGIGKNKISALTKRCGEVSVSTLSSLICSQQREEWKRHPPRWLQQVERCAQLQPELRQLVQLKLWQLQRQGQRRPQSRYYLPSSIPVRFRSG